MLGIEAYERIVAAKLAPPPARIEARHSRTAGLVANGPPTDASISCPRACRLSQSDFSFLVMIIRCAMSLGPPQEVTIFDLSGDVLFRQLRRISARPFCGEILERTRSGRGNLAAYITHRPVYRCWRPW